MDSPEVNINADPDTPPSTPTGAEGTNKPAKRWAARTWWIIAILVTYLFGLGSGYGIRALNAKDNPEPAASSEVDRLVEQIHPKDGYTIPISFGDLGPQMVEAGVFDRDTFIQVYQQAGKPLSADQLAMLDGTYPGKIVINPANAYFLLNFFWALGLSNQNPILDSGPIQQNGSDRVVGFASTGGWSLATRPIEELFSSLQLIELTPEQQARAEDAAKAVYRPCCDNPTHFPDCNHGMAMLGLLELMASQGASIDQMLESAKYVNAFWYPQQTLEQAVYFQKAEGKAFKDVDPRTLLGAQFSSASGFTALHQFLSEKGWLPQASSSGGSCGV